MKEHMIVATISFLSRDFPEEPEWSVRQWKRELVNLFEDEHRGLSQYMGCEVISIVKDGIIS